MGCGLLHRLRRGRLGIGGISGWRSAERKTIAVMLEPLEARTLFSEAAAAQLTLVSTTGTPASPVYHYDITLRNTGTTALGTLWFGWVPGQDLLPSQPISESSPQGWGAPAITGTHDTFDGSAIQWVAQSAGASLAPGQSLGGFDFSTPDNPAALNGQSPTHPNLPVETSFVYAGAPLSDAGFQFTVAGPASNSQVATNTALAASANSITLGANVTFTATVSPAMPGPAPTGTVRFLDNGTVLGTVALQSNGTAVFATSSLPAGTDNISAAYGGDATYSASTSPLVTETVSAPVANTPTLVPAIARSTLPAAVVGGSRVHGVVAIDVTNQSASAIKGPVTLDIYASSDGAIDGSATLVAALTRTLRLKAGKTAVVSVPVKALPSTLADGTYTLLARVVDASSRTTDSAAGPTIQVAAPFIALSETFARLTLPPTVIAGAKTRAVAALRITNSGNVISSGPTTLAFYATADGAVDSGATLFKQITKSLHIRPGKSVVVSVPLTLIPAVPTGDYTIVARVIDPDQQASTIMSGTTLHIASA